MNKSNLNGIFLLIITVFTFTSCEFEKDEKNFLLGQGTGISDVTLMVNDIDVAIDYFRDTLGFDIYGKGREGSFNQTISASVSFGDMTSFEIMSVKDSAIQDSVPSFISNFLPTDEGIRLFTLNTSAIDSTYTSLTSRGFQLDSVQSYRTSAKTDEGWTWDDGSAQRKSLDFNIDNPSFIQPRFIQSTSADYKKLQKEWNTYYIFTRMFRENPNGVVGLSAIKIAVDDLVSSSAQYDKMGFKALNKTDQMVRYPIYRHQEIQLVTTRDNPQLSKFTDRVYAVEFDVENLDSTYQYFINELPDSALLKTEDRLTILSDFAFGVQLEFVQEPEEQALLTRKLTPGDELDSLAVLHASNLYTKYCALCHGENREGYAADHAPSLQSKSLLATSMNNNFMRYTIQYGRANTAMAGYLDNQGGPLEYIEIELLLEYLQQLAEVDEPIELSREPVTGDIALGSALYTQNCVTCHGEKGEGISAPALANPMLLATATDHFLRYAIAEGRDGTPMIAFKDSLDSNEIDGLTAFLRSRASGWDIPEPDTVTVPTPDQYVLNPDSAAPVFNLREDRFVSAEQVNKAFQEGKRMIILDARSEVAWRQMQIPGAAPVPYYEEPENFVNDIPNDGTQIVIYCACPHAASGRVLNTLKRYGYKNAAILDEGILVWVKMGFPVRNGS